MNYAQRLRACWAVAEARMHPLPPREVRRLHRGLDKIRKRLMASAAALLASIGCSSTVTIRSVPDGALVTVDGVVAGRTPCVAPVAGVESIVTLDLGDRRAFLPLRLRHGPVLGPFWASAELETVYMVPVR